MRAMVMRISKFSRVSLGLVLCLLACEEEQKAQPAPVASAVPEKPRTPQGGPCETNSDCADRLGCAQDKTCQTYKTIECRGRGNACTREGRCTGQDNRCVAGSNADCKSSEFCEKDGRCTAQEGSCVVASAADCSTVCKKFGRCALEDGKCVAGSIKDCREADVCRGAKSCKLMKGGCIAE